MSVAWITGARGFIGRHLARTLTSSGSVVAGLGHGAWPEEDARSWGVSQWINGEIAPANLDRLASQVGEPECIYHLAGGSAVGVSLRTPEEDFRRSVDSTVQLLEWVRNRIPGGRVVLTSSAAVYGAAHDRPIAESAALMPYSPYGYHKRIAELLCESYGRNFGIATAAVRLFSVYGPGLRKQLLWDLCGRLKSSPSGLVLAGTGEEVRDWLNVDDAVNCLIAAGRNADQRALVLNGGTGRAVTVREIAERVCRAWGVQPPLRFSGEVRSGDPFYLVADPLRARGLGVEPSVQLEQGIPQYVDWYRQVESGAGS